MTLLLKKKDNTQCCVPQCKSRGTKDPELSFHRFPNERSNIVKYTVNNTKIIAKRRDEWKRILRIGKPITKRMSVCSLHFKKSDFNFSHASSRKSTLKPTVVPSEKLPLPLTESQEQRIFKEQKVKRQKKISEIKRNTEYISCSVPGCKSKYFSKTKDFIVSEENVLVFPVPHADEQFNKWKETFKQANIELTRDDHICEKHFLENDIERYSKTEILKGNIEIRKKISSLKCDAIPVKFLKPPFHITKDSSIKPPVFQNDMIKSKNSITDQLNLNSSAQGVNTIPVEIKIPDNLPVKSSADSSVNLTQCQTSIKKECKECMPYEEIVKSIQLVKKPTTYWSILCTDEFILFAKWNNKFIAEKRLVIERSLTIRVFLKEWEIEMTDLVDITSIDDVSSLLEKVENYKIDLTR